MPRLTLLLLPFLALACSGGGEDPRDLGPSEPTSPRRNILLVSIDSLRRDHVGVYGHRPEYAAEIPVTPNLDALGAEGVVFEDAWTTTSWTLPSHMSLMTGLSDRRHGVEIDDFKLDPLRKTLAEALDAQGYATGGYFSGPYLDPKYGFGRGFDDYRSGMLTAAQFAAEVRERNDEREAAGRPPMSEQEVKRMRDRISHWDITSPRINQLGIEFLDGIEEDEPFFLFLHYFDAHYDHIPWSMDAGLASAFDPDYAGSFDGANWYFDPRVMDLGPPYERRIGERDLRHILANYDAEIHWVDRHIGRIVQELKDRGLYEETVIMVVSDHGDEFFEHNSIGHRSTLFAEQCRIPMILRVPSEADDGRRVPTLTTIYDVAPTLLDYAGGLPLRQLPESEGRSLRDVVDGEELAPRSAFQRIYSGGHRRARRLNIRDGWRDSRYTVLRQFNFDEEASTEEAKAVQVLTRRSDGSPYLVFDRREDPEEMMPLATGDPRHTEAIAAFREAFLRAEEEAAKLPVSPLMARLSEELSAEEQAALDALGYAETSSGTEGAPEILPLLPFPAPGSGG
jgi:arylsulfatase A-like enzyme